MDLRPTTLDGVCLVKTGRMADERGYFARLHCASEFGEAGIEASFVQSNLSFNRAAGTFRGLHFQVPPSCEGKLVRCFAGSIYDVVLDIRPDSSTFLKHEWFELTADNMDAVFIPSGFAHGFITGAEDTLVHYEMTDYYSPDHACGVRWCDPRFGISLPREIDVINERDALYPDVDLASFDCFRETD